MKALNVKGKRLSFVAPGKNTLDNDQCETVERAASRVSTMKNGKTNQTTKEGTFQDG